MRKIIISTIAIASLLATGAAVSTASAGGLMADVLRGTGVITKDQAEQLDDLHDQVKRMYPDYGRSEEETTNDVRKNLGLPRHCQPLYDKYGKQVDCR